MAAHLLHSLVSGTCSQFVLYWSLPVSFLKRASHLPVVRVRGWVEVGGRVEGSIRRERRFVFDFLHACTLHAEDVRRRAEPAGAAELLRCPLVAARPRSIAHARLCEQAGWVGWRRPVTRSKLFIFPLRVSALRLDSKWWSADCWHYGCPLNTE